MKPEDLALFGEVVEGEVVESKPPADDWGDDWGDTKPAVEPVAPPRTKPAGIIWPDCSACGTSLNPENASKLQSGDFVHIGCPKASPAVLPPDAPKNDVNAPLPAKATKAKKAKADPAPQPVQIPTGTVMPFVVGPQTRALFEQFLTNWPEIAALFRR